MNLPASVVTAFLEEGILLQAGKVYCDLKSENPKFPSQVKPKNKLYCNFHTIDDSFFLILGSKAIQFDLHTRIEFQPTDYSWIQSGFLTKWPGYTCPSNKEFLTEDEISQKVSDLENGFPHVGSINDDAIKKVTEKCKSYIYRSGFPLSQANSAMAISLWGEDSSNEFLDKLIK